MLPGGFEPTSKIAKILPFSSAFDDSNASTLCDVISLNFEKKEILRFLLLEISEFSTVQCLYSLSKEHNVLIFNDMYRDQSVVITCWEFFDCLYE